MGRGRPPDKTRGNIDPTKRGDIVLAFRFLKRQMQKTEAVPKFTLYICEQISNMLKVGKTTSSLKNKLEENKRQRNTYSKIDNFDRSVLNQTINLFYSQRVLPSSKMIMDKIENKIRISPTLLRIILHEMGNRWRKTNDNMPVAIEKPDNNGELLIWPLLLSLTSCICLFM